MVRIWVSTICVIGMLASASGQSIGSIAIGKKKQNQSSFNEHIDFEGMVRRYLNKETPVEPLEGIYSVSAIITRKGGFLTNPDKEKVIVREDNYAKVVIIKDTENPKREYVEVSLASKIPGQYPAVGEFTSLAEGGAYVYKHYEPKTEGVKYSFVISEGDILDGILVEIVKRKTITYKLSYLKVYPKVGDLSGGKLTNNK